MGQPRGDKKAGPGQRRRGAPHQVGKPWELRSQTHYALRDFDLWRVRSKGPSHAMLSGSSHRLFLCEGCRAQTWICTRCDRGNRYCGEECAGKARRTKLRIAGVLYQASPRGARKNAERQKRMRTRRALQACSVTHQSSAEPATSAEPTQDATRVAFTRAVPVPLRRFRPPPAPTCSFCGCSCGPRSRTDFLWKGK